MSLPAGLLDHLHSASMAPVSPSTTRSISSFEFHFIQDDLRSIAFELRAVGVYVAKPETHIILFLPAPYQKNNKLSLNRNVGAGLRRPSTFENSRHIWLRTTANQGEDPPTIVINLTFKIIFL
jgi:hypothetical protein